MYIPRNYGDPDYWEKRYQNDDSIFDWYFDWDEFFEQHYEEISFEPPVLVVGCGNSDFSEKLESKGIFPVVSTDISHSVINKMAKKFGGCYLPMDVCDLQFRNESFQCVVDKGTLDALICKKDYQYHLSRMICEISRVLVHNGVFIEVTFGETGQRLNILDNPDILSWSLVKMLEFKNEIGTANVFIFRKFKEIIRENFRIFQKNYTCLMTSMIPILMTMMTSYWSFL